MRVLAALCWLLAAGCAQLPKVGDPSAQEIAGMSFSAGNNVRLLQDGEATYRAMFLAIGAATDHINLESYKIEDDEVGRRLADMLLSKRAQGVQVNVVYDSVGSISTPRPYFERLAAGGVQVLEFNP